MNTKNDKLLELIHSVTGTKWDWYWGDKAPLGCAGKWQLMPEDEAKVNGFWNWDATNSRQWFNSKDEATKALLSAWFSFRKGTPSEVAADLLAIDNEIAEVKRQRNSFRDCFQYELDANIRLEKEIKRLRESLMEIGGTFHAVEGITMNVNAALHPLPNARSEPCGQSAEKSSGPSEK